MKPRIIFLTGPTAVGKSEVAVFLAEKINGEIISCDSMQIYKGMDTITSKPSSNLRKKIPHHLIGIIEPVKEYNVSRYRRDALKKIKEILGRAKTPILAGGSGLYVSVLIDGIFKAKTENKALREKLYREARDFGSIKIYERLKKIDPRAAGRIHPNDTKRIIRALEVYEATGKPISELQKERKGLIDKYDIKIFCLDMERDKLYKHIDARVDRMFRCGLLQEVKRLFNLKMSRTASCAIGIKEIKGYLDGLYRLEEARQIMKRNTRLYAKRQLTWFRKDRRIEWIKLEEKETPKKAAERILRHL